MIFLALIFYLVLAVANGSNLLDNFLEGNREFTTNVYRELVKDEGGSFVVCPISIQVVLAMTAIGSRNRTFDELTATLRIPQDVGEIEDTFRELTPGLQRTGNYTLASANKVYVAEGFDLNSNYANSVVENFRSEIDNVDFVSNETIPRINSWVLENTHGKIREFLPPGSVDEYTRLVLINTLYFSGRWEKSFPGDNTAVGSFFVGPSVEKRIDFMRVVHTLRYASNENLKAKFVELYYRDSDISMTIALPSKLGGFDLLEERIGEVLQPQVYEELKVRLQLPKFTTSSDVPLNNLLRRMGIREAFESSADFSGMDAKGEKRLKIDNVFQKALVEVNEEGTTAAAATGVIISGRSAEKGVDFLANHPFIYYLKSESSGILFVGRYMGP